MFNTSVDSIMSTFTKTIAKLESHSKKLQTQAWAHQDTARHYNSKADVKRVEAERTKTIANKLTGILN